jgi:hypothetical protein
MSVRTSPWPSISIINQSTVVADTDIKPHLIDFQNAVTYDFAPYWNELVWLRFVGSGPPYPGSWWIAILDNSDQAGALGYHDLSADNLPLAKVFAKSDKDFGLNWQVTFTHELFEMLADSFIVYSAQNMTDGKIYALEVADPCEDDSQAYQRGSSMISDFITPDWFEGNLSGAGRFDFQHLLSTPYSILKGGYMQYWDCASTSWHMVQDQEKPSARWKVYGEDYRTQKRNKIAKKEKLTASTAYTKN